VLAAFLKEVPLRQHSGNVARAEDAAGEDTDLAATESMAG